MSGDGKSFLIGAPSEASAAFGVNNIAPGQDDTSAPLTGAAYLFRLSNGTWSQTDYIKPKYVAAAPLVPSAAGGFGAAVAISADGSSAAVGQPNESTANEGIDNAPRAGQLQSSGAAYVTP